MLTGGCPDKFLNRQWCPEAGTSLLLRRKAVQRPCHERDLDLSYSRKAPCMPVSVFALTWPAVSETRHYCEPHIRHADDALAGSAWQPGTRSSGAALAALTSTVWSAMTVRYKVTWSHHQHGNA